MKNFRIVYNELEIPSDFIGECICPSCGDDDRRADYNEPCRFCGHNTYKPCLDVGSGFFTNEAGFSDDDIEHIESLSAQDETTLGGMVSDVECIIRLADSKE